jgi:hypothetical protein
MRNIKKYRSSLIILFTFFLSILFFTQCNNSGNSKKSSQAKYVYADFAGSASCAGCHKSIYESHIHTAHFHTSEAATAKSIMGSFDSGKNTFRFSTGGIVAMEQQGDNFYQVGYIGGIERRRERFDITVGSGTKGQSYLTWADSNLHQLPITYFTAANHWSNSPGYPDKMGFGRAITSRCLECHITFAEKMSEPLAEPVALNKNRLMLGVDCERCHGPGAKHVEFQTQNPNEKIARFIINPASFSRQQSLDMCAICHGGRLQKTKPSFEFTAGDKLSDYFMIDTVAKDVNTIDVHGNQYGLLSASKCFKNSKTLTCNTCHNTHENEKGKTALFSQRCTTCHNDKHADAVLCKLTKTIGPQINNSCTGCHMPEMPSMAIAVLLQDDVIPTRASMHTHLIKPYPEESQKILAFLKKK